jgi:hypothetical protein
MQSTDSFITEKDILLCDFHYIHEAVDEPADSLITKKRQSLLRELSHPRHATP